MLLLVVAVLGTTVEPWQLFFQQWSTSASPRAGCASPPSSPARPVLTMPRKTGLLTLRGCIVFAIVIMAIKLVQVTAH
jgi:Mn2+/Fe2+ NRAMP family transporter